jgi:hypothetical protein
MEEETEFPDITKLSGDMKANLAVLIETGVCKVNSSASLGIL